MTPPPTQPPVPGLQVAAAPCADLRPCECLFPNAYAVGCRAGPLTAILRRQTRGLLPGLAHRRLTQAALRREGSGFHVLAEEPVLPTALPACAQTQPQPPAALQAPTSFSSPQEAHQYTQAALAEIRQRLEELLQAE